MTICHKQRSWFFHREGNNSSEKANMHVVEKKMTTTITGLKGINAFEREKKNASSKGYLCFSFHKIHTTTQQWWLYAGILRNRYFYPSEYSTTRSGGRKPNLVVWMVIPMVASAYRMQPQNVGRYGLYSARQLLLFDIYGEEKCREML